MSLRKRKQQIITIALITCYMLKHVHGCQEGFLRLNNSCVKYNACTKPCPTHAYCTQIGTCACQPTYRYESGICVPNCPKGCGVNADCVAPERCQCRTGTIAVKSPHGQNCQRICGANETQDCVNVNVVSPMEQKTETRHMPNDTNAVTLPPPQLPPATCNETITIFNKKYETCKMHWLIHIVIYGISLVILVISIVLIYKFYKWLTKRLSRKFSASPVHVQSPRECVIVYRPDSEDATYDDLYEDDVARTRSNQRLHQVNVEPTGSNYTPPPAYDSLLPTKC